MVRALGQREESDELPVLVPIDIREAYAFRMYWMQRIAVVMAGGSGERFWPLSRAGRPKQLLPLTHATMSMLEEAVRRLTSFPAENLRIADRGVLERGRFADVVVFDPGRVQDHATYDEPHQYATGVSNVAVNGTLVLRDGEHTGALPGRVVRGPGYAPER